VLLEMDKLNESEQSRDVYDSVVLTNANFMLQLVVGTSKVVAERDPKNSPSDELPCVLPVDLCRKAVRKRIEYDESSGFDLLPNITLVYQLLFQITYYSEYYFQSLAAFTTILATLKNNSQFIIFC
jgi:hypothetical protein